MFKLNSSELKKMFMRPAVYVMLFVLAIVLVVCAMMYNPKTRVDPTTTFGGANETVSMAFSEFNKSSSTDGKLALDANLDLATQKVQDFSTQASYKDFLFEKLSAINNELTNPVGDTFLNKWVEYSGAQAKTQELKNNVIVAMQKIKTLADDVYKTCLNDLNQDTIDFFATTDDINNIKTYSLNLFLAIPSAEELSGLDHKALLAVCENLRNENFVPTEQIKIVENAPKIVIVQEKVDDLVKKYYTSISSNYSDSVLSNIYAKISEYVEAHSSEKTDEAKAGFNALATQYKLASQIATELMTNSFYQAKTGALSDQELQKYIGFENYNSYAINQTLVLDQYLLDNNIFDGQYLVNFNYNTPSGYTASAYDFTVYAMQILSIVLTVFALFFAVTILAGDFQNGAMKMIASRPLTRRQIVSGKTMACVNFTLIFAIFAFIASFVVGFAMFGLGDANLVLAVFNASSVIVVQPWVMMLAYFASVVLNILFFILLANLLSVIFRSTVLANFLALAVFVGGLILSALCFSANWFVFTPFAYLDLFRFFGSATSSGGFMTFGITPMANFWVALGVFVGLIIILDALTKLIFRKRDIT